MFVPVKKYHLNQQLNMNLTMQIAREEYNCEKGCGGRTGQKHYKIRWKQGILDTS